MAGHWALKTKKLPTDHPNWHWPHPIGGGFGYMPASGSGTLR